jgi:hypothetical protein
MGKKKLASSSNYDQDGPGGTLKSKKFFQLPFNNNNNNNKEKKKSFLYNLKRYTALTKIPRTLNGNRGGEDHRRRGLWNWFHAVIRGGI